MNSKQKSRLALLFLATVIIGTLSPAKAEPNYYPYAPVRPGDYRGQPGIRGWYQWQQNPNRPRRSFGRRYNSETPVYSRDIYESFVVPDQNPMSWGEASQLCDRDGGNLEWRRNRKVCIKYY